LFVQSEQEEQHEWRVAEESMRVHMRSIDVHSCQRSLFVLLFNMMTDPNVRGNNQQAQTRMSDGRAEIWGCLVFSLLILCTSALDFRFFFFFFFFS